MKRIASALLLAGLFLVGCEKKVSPAIEGKWVMPTGGFMGYSLALNSSGKYTRWFWSDMINGNEIPENPKKGAYTFTDGWVTIPVEHRYHDGRSYIFDDRFKRETINGVEIMLRTDAEEIWRRSGMIYTGGLLIKVSDDPNFSESDSDPKTNRLFSGGVTEWSREAEASNKQKSSEQGGAPNP